MTYFIKRIAILFLFTIISVSVFAQLKTWWFFGYEQTDEDGMKADIQALKDAGFTGVVYYDQTHGDSHERADLGFSSSWWQHLKSAAQIAHDAGMTFEMNISNGYVAGGRWIDPAHAMQRVASAHITVVGGREVVLPLPKIEGKEGYVKDIALVAFPIDTIQQKFMRSLTIYYKPTGKGRSGAMQIPQDSVSRQGRFSGAKFKEMPDIGVLEASDDSVHWRQVLSIPHMYSSQGGYPYRTLAFAPTSARYWRISTDQPQLIRQWGVSPVAMLDRWEEKSGLHSDFTEAEQTPNYSKQEVISTNDILRLDRWVSNDTLRWSAPEGTWTVLRLAAVITGARSKHGRENLLGYECDKLSRAAAELHWNSYMQVILDSLQVSGIDYVEGVTMDSHEGGSQNWTPLMAEEFRNRRGYDLLTYAPVLAGYIVDSSSHTSNVLYDLRRTINECMRDNYYATFQRLATENDLTFTAQAIGNALCITGDAISVKQVVEKPQGEFWAYQQTGAYDVKDCSSAAHLYGKPIASAEAMTDATYQNTLHELKRVADIALSFGAQEMVVCATPHVPYISTTSPYVPGREYAINRTHPRWNELKPMWRSLKHSLKWLQRGKPSPDVLVYFGDDLPMKILTHRLPNGLEDLEWDACTGDALTSRLVPTSDGCLTTSDGIIYRAIIIAHDAYISPKSFEALDRFKQAGVPVLNDGSSIARTLSVDNRNIVHTHRLLEDKSHLFFLANISAEPCDVEVLLPNTTSVWLWSTQGNHKRRKLKPISTNTYQINFKAGESLFLQAR